MTAEVDQLGLEWAVKKGGSKIRRPRHSSPDSLGHPPCVRGQPQMQCVNRGDEGKPARRAKPTRQSVCEAGREEKIPR